MRIVAPDVDFVTASVNVIAADVDSVQRVGTWIPDVDFVKRAWVGSRSTVHARTV
jgi:hypothetical protein